MNVDSIPLAVGRPRVLTTGALPERVMPYAKGADVRIAFLPEDMLDPMLWRAAVCRVIEAGAACVRVSLPDREVSR